MLEVSQSQKLSPFAVRGNVSIDQKTPMEAKTRGVAAELSGGRGVSGPAAH